MRRSAAEVEHAVGLPAELLQQDAATAAEHTEALQVAALAEIELERVTGRPTNALRNAAQPADESYETTTLGRVTEERAP